MQAECKVVNESPELLLDGKVADRVWARPDLPGFLATDKIDLYKDAGIRIHLVSMSQPQLLFWDGGEDYYPEMLETYLRWICNYDEDALLIPYVGFRTSGPYKWVRNHLDECTLMSNGERYDAPSAASELWRRDVRVAIERIVRHIDGCDIADRVIGYNFVQGANEWFAYSAYHRDPWRRGFADYSEPFQNRFRAYVKTRYEGDEQALRRAWKDDSVTFETVEVPNVDERLSFGHDGMFFARETLGMKLVDFYTCWHETWADLAESYCRTAKEASARKILCGLMSGYTYSGALAGYAQVSNYGGARMLFASPYVDFFQSPYHYLNRSFPGVHFAQHAPESVMLRGKLFVDQLDTKTHLKRNAANNTNARTPWETEQILKRDVAHALGKNCHCYWMEIYHGVFGGFSAPVKWDPMDFDDPAIKATIAELTALAEQMPELRPRPVTEVAWFTSKESPYHMRCDYLFERFFVDALRQWQLPCLGTPFDDYVFEDLPDVTRDYKVMIFPNANYMSSAVRRLIRQKIADGATAVFFYAPGYVDENGPSLANCRELTGLELAMVPRRDWLHVQFTRPYHALMRGVAETGYGTNIDPAVLNATQEWMRFPGNVIDDYRFNPVFHCVDPQADVLAELTDFRVTHGVGDENPASIPRGEITPNGKAGLVVKPLGKGRVIWSAAPLLPVAVLRNILREAGVHLYSPDGDLVYANDSFLTICAQTEGEREVLLPASRTVLDALTGEPVASGTSFRLQTRYGETRILRLQ
jgi:hypothetical protein